MYAHAQEHFKQIKDMLDEYRGCYASDDSDRYNLTWHVSMLGLWNKMTRLPELHFASARVLDSKKHEDVADEGHNYTGQSGQEHRRRQYS